MTERHQSSNGSPPRKIDRLREIMAAGDWQGAIAFAVRFPRLGNEKLAIERAHMAFTRRQFCLSIGKSPDDLIAEGIAALMRRYG